MKWLFVSAFLALLASTAFGQEVGTHVCDTEYQAALYADKLGYNPPATAEAVNTEVQTPDACVASTFLLLKGEVVATIRTHAALWSIHKVVVVAVWKGQWVSIAPQEYYASFKLEEA
jgi:hypothetical protein